MLAWSLGWLKWVCLVFLWRGPPFPHMLLMTMPCLCGKQECSKVRCGFLALPFTFFTSLSLLELFYPPFFFQECNVAYSVPMDQWVVDHGTPTRNASVWKFAMAEALSRRERQSGGIAASSQQPRALRPPSQWPSNAIHVGVHFRVNDGLLVSDSGSSYCAI